jgi:uncharacterized membrane protein (UPF0127 family)
MFSRPSRIALFGLCVLTLCLLLACGGDDRPDVAGVVSTSSPEACGSAGSAAPAVTSAATLPPTPETTASTGGAARSDLPLVEFARQSGGTACLPIEVVPPDEFGVGLSGRYELDDRGMLFYFGGATRGSFWMKNTHVDLSIAFVGGDNHIVEIREMQAESLDFVTPSADYAYTIEAQPGWYTRNEVAAGDEVRFAFDLKTALEAAGRK